MTVLLLGACTAPPAGLRLTPDGTGPVVVVDWDAEPLPDVPFPNDLATRPDPSSPTGLRVSLPEEADLELDRNTRANLNELTGFGINAPILVSFDGDLDVGAILLRQLDDHHHPASFRDDAILLVDVDPKSPDFGQPVPLDFMSGRFPMDATRTGNYLDNDPRVAEPSALFETGEEDLDGDGVLDRGEDTDGDGLLDHPNVWPPGGDHRLDLLTFYDLQSRSLILRPVVPLREETRYAVVLTEALVDPDGAPVRSPWEWVNHTRQTDALEPVLDALDDLGRGVDDVAFAWTFTTGRVTTDLWDLAEGLRGRGPFAHLAEQYPAGVVEAHELHTLTDVADPLVLPVEVVIAPLATLQLFPEYSVEFLSAAVSAWTDRIVGGAFVTPDLLYDRDDGGVDDSDEHWVYDPATGAVDARPRRVTFTCAIPKAGDGVEPPWPVVIHHHGYGSTRIEFVAFAYAMNRQGLAVCALDAHGHGIELGGTGYEDLVAGLLALTGTEPLWWHLLDDRVRDLDNDGIGDPGGDMFSADAFHTRDMVRQPVLDAVQLVEALRACGTGEMERVIPTAAGPIHTGERLVSCDWDGDGQPDFAGPDLEVLVEGVSQGGIMSSLGVAVQDATAGVVTVPGGGLVDLGLRTDIDDVAYTMVGRAISPLVVGYAAEGGIDVYQQVISVNDDALVYVGHVDRIPMDGTVVVRNLTLGEEEVGLVPADGRFRVPIAANALDAGEKKALLGIPDSGHWTGVYSVPDNEGLGDRLEIEVLDAAGRRVELLDRFADEVLHEGVTMEERSPLVAASWGLGLRRGSRDLQRVIGVLGMAIEPADPIAYARRWADEPFAGSKDVLVHLTLGDTTVPESTGVALARAAGLVDFRAIDPRYGTTADRFLVDRGVVHGLEEYWPYVGSDGGPVLFDPDDLDEGADLSGAPSEEPLRSVRHVGDAELALRFLQPDPNGTHAYIVPNEDLPFDWALFGGQQMATFLATGAVVDDPCLATRDCPFLRPFPQDAP